MEIKTTHKGATAPVVVQKEFGANLAELVSKFGEEKVFIKALGGFVIELQNLVRVLMVAGKTVEEISAAADTWVPGTRTQRTRKPAKDKFLESFSSMTAEQQAELLAQLQAKAGGGQKRQKAA